MQQLSHLTLNSTLADLPTSDFKVDSNTLGEEIEKTFHEHLDLPGAIITSNDRPIGILPRAKFFEWLSLPYGIELYLKRPIQVLLDAIRQDLKVHLQDLKTHSEIEAYPGHCLLLSQTSSIHQAVEIALGRPTLLAYEPIVVASTCGQWRLLDMYVLLLAQSQLFELAKDAANAANKAKSDFLASMSHELRTPLNAILGFAQIMDRDPKLPRTHQQHVSIIYRAGEHLLELIGDVLDMSKIESGRTTLNPTNCDLHRSLNSLRDMLQLKAATKGLQLNFEYGRDVPQYLCIDMAKLRQVLINLLGNAIKFTHTGGVTLRVFAIDPQNSNSQNSNPQTQIQTQTLHFEVEDTGVGIAPEEMDRLFTPFAQTEAGRNSGMGTGLGLAIAQNFIELMGGQIRASSTPGTGTTFSFEIEVRSVPGAVIPTAPQTRKAIALATDGCKYRILVADDRLEGRLVLVELLTSLGFSVCEAQNGREVIELWSSYEPHLILMDMRMPVINGLEATRQIKRHSSATVIIALTASIFENDRQTILATGCDDFINKPFREEVLLDKIAQHLGVRYVYDRNASDLCENDIELHPSDRHLRALLSQMPPNWVENLHQAALKCRDDKVLELANAIPESAVELANCLEHWANDFLFERILELIQSDSSIDISGSSLALKTPLKTRSTSIDAGLRNPLENDRTILN